MPSQSARVRTRVRSFRVRNFRAYQGLGFRVQVCCSGVYTVVAAVYTRLLQRCIHVCCSGVYTFGAAVYTRWDLTPCSLIVFFCVSVPGT
jgi:hypothetical protein